MRPIWSLLSVWLIAAKRLWANKWLNLSLLVGWTIAVGLSLSVPLYADAVNYRMLRDELEASRDGKPPFSFLFRYLGSAHGAVEWETAERADAYLRNAAIHDIGLPPKDIVRFFKTDNFQLFPVNEAAYAGIRNPLEWVSLGFISDLAQHVTLTEGSFPAPPSPLDEATEVLLHPVLAEELGLQVGEEYILFGRKQADQEENVQIKVRIAGFWQPTNPYEDYWFYRPEAFDRVLLTTESAFHQWITPALKGEVYLGLWWLLLDGKDVFTEDVPSLVRQIATTVTRAHLLLPDTELAVSPTAALQNFRQQTFLLTILLSVLAIPVMVLVLYFIVLTAAMAVQRQQAEIAIVRSRGMTPLQVVGVLLVEGLVLGILALLLGTVLGIRVALTMGQIRSFLSLTNRPPLVVQLSWSSLRFAVGAMVLALIGTLMPALSSVGHTIVTFKQEQARVLRRPFWQRFFVDVLLLIPSLYGYHLLKQRGTLSVNLVGGATSDPFQNPLLFLVPALFVFSLGLLGLRLFPWFMSILARLTDWLPSAALPLAFRHLSRSSGYYTGPLLLLILTLGLATFTASMALTLDGHLVDRTYYEVGSDLHLMEIGESSRSWAVGPGAANASLSEASERQYTEPLWLFLPVSQHLEVGGVQRAARVGEYTAYASFSERQEGRFVGVDWLDFSRVGFFRQDFATQPLGGLMNLLALDQRSLLANRGFLAANRLNVGDSVRLELTMGGDRRTIDFIIVGAVDLFPTQYPEDGPVFIGNLDYAFQEMGDEYPYDVWLKTDGERPPNVIVEDLKQTGFIILDYTDAEEQIISEQTRPARQGLFGILSVGFLAAAGFTILGFLLYTIFSFRHRYIELGVLRAIGLSNTQMTGFLVCEQLALVVASAILGTGIGVTASRLFIPFLQVREGAHPHIPPFIVNIAWGDILHIYAVFGGILLVAVGLTLAMLMRMRVFEVIKLGEMV